MPILENSHGLEVREPAALGAVVRVADVMADIRPAAAHMTDPGHGSVASSEVPAWTERGLNIFLEPLPSTWTALAARAHERDSRLGPQVATE